MGIAKRKGNSAVRSCAMRRGVELPDPFQINEREGAFIPLAGRVGDESDAHLVENLTAKIDASESAPASESR
ncbi:hypothetical protein [Methylobacterium sp. E-045]|uniref:hypothetical protein n=1 Tax=Methylobacterium sp. E-045 TaxID=2836575 RepID=UPI001FBA51BE|nr:hypothetical protein [Methylobacterium sp. E-045]MCJ2128484.1 hypothetical protein [Methylobacterium sp. E-045]